MLKAQMRRNRLVKCGKCGKTHIYYTKVRGTDLIQCKECGAKFTEHEYHNYYMNTKQYHL